MKKEIENKLIDCIGIENVKLEEPMEKHTTFRIGGPADYFLCPQTAEELKAVIHVCKETGTPYFILGNGSNLLVSDKGYRGAVIQIWKNMSEVSVEDETKIRAQAGAQLSKIASCALEQSLEGFEFAAGIPGTLGGAVVMNAGAYGGEMKDILVSADLLTKDGEVVEVPVEEISLSYRHSRVMETGEVVLGVTLKLVSGEKEKIEAVMQELRQKRQEKQPLEFPSAGSTFKRPEGYFAGKLIMDAGLRGYRVGDAQVSEKHCGFVINRGQATAAEVEELMRRVQEKVEQEFQVRLEPEVRRLGEFS